MDLGLDGRTAVVMGASQGLGKATAKQLAEEGAHVILVARREDALREVQRKIQDAGGLLTSRHVICLIQSRGSRCVI